MQCGFHQILAAKQDSAALRPEETLTATNAEQVRYRRALAEWERRSGRLGGAEGELLAAIGQLTSGATGDLRKRNTRQWRLALDRIYRDLVQVELQRGDTEGAYRTWQAYLVATETGEADPTITPAAAEGTPATVVTYARLGDRYGVWVRNGGHAEFFWAAAGAAELDALAREYAALCARPQSSLEAIANTGLRLRRELLDQGIGTAPPQGVLLIQPDGQLGAIPWNSLALDSGEPLGENMLVAMAPMSAPSSGVLYAGPELPHRAVVVGATVIGPELSREYLPLPGVPEEIAAVCDTFPDAIVLVGANATAKKIDRALSQADVLHFAGHAAVTPGGVRLLVAPDPANCDTQARDGFWQSRPTAGKLQLAVLSACSTARYEEQESADPQHLAHALLLDGARQVMAARWNADSLSASRFMQAFYRYLRRGRPALEALRAAAMEVRRQPGWAHPYYWAVYSMFVRT